MTIKEGDTIPVGDPASRSALPAQFRLMVRTRTDVSLARSQSGTFGYVPWTVDLEDPTVCGIPGKVSTDSWKGKWVMRCGAYHIYEPVR